MKFLLSLVATKNGKRNYRSNFSTNHLIFLDILSKSLKIFGCIVKNLENVRKKSTEKA